MSEQKRFWSKRIQNAVPYVAGEQPKDRKFIKLNTNENPYPPSPKVAQAVMAAADDTLRLYPDPDNTALREACSQVFGLPADHIFCGNGSDEILAFSFQAFFDEESPDALPVVFPDITYSFYEVYASYFRVPVKLSPLKDDFSIQLEDFKGPNGGVVLANPNAPTGRALPLDQIREVIEANPNRVVLVDEAYGDFGGESALGLVREYPNLLVVHTLSKSRSLAGLRVGLAFGHPDLIAALCCVRDSINSYTVDRLAQAAAAAAVLDTQWFAQCREQVMATREWTADALTKLGFHVIPSSANFLFVTHPERDGKTLFAALRERGILVRRWDRPRIDQYLRITIGSDAEMECLVKELKDILG